MSTSPGAEPEQLWASVAVDAAPTAIVAAGGRLDPATVRAAYRHGAFPWPPASREEDRHTRAQVRRLAALRAVRRLPPYDAGLAWFSPDPRAVLVAGTAGPGAVRVSRSLRATLRRAGWTTTVDRCFADVVAGCADRERTWISPALRSAFAGLHAAGEAHSVEVWSPTGALVGGLYGLQVGGVFCGESMFHREAGASKVALVDLVARLPGGAVVDCQLVTDHLVSLGAVPVRRADYLAALARLRDAPAALDVEPREVARLAAAPAGADAGIRTRNRPITSRVR